MHNSALISSHRNETFDEIIIQPNEWGRMVESSIGAHLINQSLTNRFEVFYWRDRNKEVDFVIEKRGKVVALEIKSTTAGSTEGMRAFKDQFKPHKMLLIGKSSLPWEDFLKMNPNDLF